MTPNDFLYIVDLNHARDIDVESGISEPAWEDFRDSLMKHQVRRLKDGPAFLPVCMLPENEWVLKKTKKGNVYHYRFDENVESITSLVIDIDKPGALEVAEQVFEGYEYLAYTTHNYTAETPWKYRMVVRLAEPIPIEEWPSCFQALRSRINIDPACCNPSRCYYYPSHSTESTIAPRAFHRMGRAITMQDILNLQAEATQSRGRSPMKMRTIGTMPNKQVRAKRHFSGTSVAHYDRLPEVVSFTRKAFMERHILSVKDYETEDSRHNLALSVTSREFAMLGPKTNIRALLVFLYQAADQGSKRMIDGNTPDELPGMLVTAMEKYAPEAYDKLLTDHGDGAYRWLIGEVDWAQKHYDSIREMPDPAVQQNKPDSDYMNLRHRNRDLLRQYVSNGDARSLFSSVLERELDVEQPDYDVLANTLIRFCKGYLRNVRQLNENQVQGLLSETVRGFAAELRPDGGAIHQVDAGKRTFIRSSLLVELAKERKHAASQELSP